MNIYEIANKFGVSLAVLRKLEKGGVLKVNKTDNAEIARMRSHLSRNARLTVAQMISLIEAPDTAAGLDVYRARAEAQIDALGAVMETLAPRVVAHAVIDAAAGDDEGLRILSEWVRSVAPEIATDYHWFAVRIALAQFPAQRDETLARMNLAFAKLRARPEMAGWWHREKTHVKYQKPLDL